jgi:hypothetical protein
MRRPAARAREAGAEAERLRKAVRSEVDAKGVKLRELSTRTKRSDGYWSQVFNGTVAFTVEHLFAALLAVNTDPREFFRRYYGLSEGSAEGTDSIEEAVLRTLRRFGIKPAAEGGSDSRST